MSDAVITISLTSTEYQALATIAYDPEEYLTNFAKVRASSAIDEAVQTIVQEALDSGNALPSGTKEEIFLNANLPTAKQLTDEALSGLGGNLPT